jgi:3-demethoxyubiquinol 3-hydroxylase
MRKLSLIDRVITELNLGMNSVFVVPSKPSRPNPSEGEKEENLSSEEKRHSAGLMRVDHTGEICAQALYRGQAFFAKSRQTRESFLMAAEEEEDHLVWCDDRLRELNARPSYLIFFWYFASFFIGVTAASFGDDWSNGFVVETENQVERHLNSHLNELPPGDYKSRAILEQMKADEIAHAFAAKARGGRDLSHAVKSLMWLQSQVMTRTSYWV